jgi:hypothetical protein
MMSRPGIFDEDETLDLSQFKPKEADDTTASPHNDVVRQVADAGGFPSRLPQPFVQRRQPRTYRTGRSAVFTVKTLPATLDDFYAISERKGWKVGETFERAVELLKQAEGGSVD